MNAAQSSLIAAATSAASALRTFVILSVVNLALQALVVVTPLDNVWTTVAASLPNIGLLVLLFSASDSLDHLDEGPIDDLVNNTLSKLRAYFAASVVLLFLGLAVTVSIVSV